MKKQKMSHQEVTRVKLYTFKSISKIGFFGLMVKKCDGFFYDNVLRLIRKSEDLKMTHKKAVQHVFTLLYKTMVI